MTENTQRRNALAKCCDLADNPNLLDEFVRAIRQLNVVGDTRNLKLLYLAATSRVLDHPVSIAIKSSSAAGKSYELEEVLTFFPASAYHWLTSMTPHALIYSREPLSHRMLIVAEQEGARDEKLSYFLRTLLSERRVRHEAVVNTERGFETKVIEREGPIGLFTTSTRIQLHAENETRLLSISVTESRAHTQDILLAQAGEDDKKPADLGPWHALQDYVALGPNRVRIPYGKHLARLIKPVDLRLHRDHKMVRGLIQAHALLHQRTRRVTAAGEIIAKAQDYEQVWSLISDIVSHGVEATVPPGVRSVVEAVKKLEREGKQASVASLADCMDVNKSTAARQSQAASKMGYLINRQSKSGVAFDFAIRLPLPDDDDSVLPDPLKLKCNYLNSIGAFR